MKRQFWAILVAATLAITGGNALAVEQTMTFSGGDVYETWIGANRIGGGYAMGGSQKNYGSLGWFGANEPGSARGLIRFDVSALAGQYATISSVTMRLYQVSGAAGLPVDAFRITPVNSNWQEGTDTGSWTSWGGTWNQTSWSARLRGASGMPSAAWQGNGGGAGLGQPGGTGYRVPAFGTATSNGIDTWMDIPIIGDGLGGSVEALLDQWVQNPVYQVGNGLFGTWNPDNQVLNEGMLLQSSNGMVVWSSNEGAVSPELVVVYDDGLAPVVPGDVDEDTDVDADDIDMMGDHIRTSTPPTGANYDLTGFDEFGNPDPEGGYPDGVVDLLDLDYLIRSLVTTDLGPGSEYGDFNLDGLVDTTDLTRLAANYGVGTMWAEGNANRNFDLLIDTTDLTILSTYFGFDRSADAIPEPASAVLLVTGALAVLRRRRA